MTAFDRAWGMVRKSTPLQEEIENQKAKSAVPTKAKKNAKNLINQLEGV